jgi:hypothetical protein
LAKRRRQVRSDLGRGFARHRARSDEWVELAERPQREKQGALALGAKFAESTTSWRRCFEVSTAVVTPLAVPPCQD